MYLEIVSPETTLFKGEVDSVAVPGVNGEFEMLNMHAAVVSTLKDGFVKIRGTFDLMEENASKFQKKKWGLLVGYQLGYCRNEYQ